MGRLVKIKSMNENVLPSPTSNTLAREEIPDVNWKWSQCTPHTTNNQQPTTNNDGQCGRGHPRNACQSTQVTNRHSHDSKEPARGAVEKVESADESFEHAVTS
jgi:hypothetical protein